MEAITEKGFARCKTQTRVLLQVSKSWKEREGKNKEDKGKDRCFVEIASV
jgi:hypothetical protein